MVVVVVVVEDVGSLLAEIRTPLSATSILPLLKLNHRSLYESLEHERDVGACVRSSTSPHFVILRFIMRNYHGQVRKRFLLAFFQFVFKFQVIQWKKDEL